MTNDDHEEKKEQQQQQQQQQNNKQLQQDEQKHHSIEAKQLQKQQLRFEDYQIHEDYKPDKEHTWTYPIQNEGWVHAHNAIRGELDALERVLKVLRIKPISTREDWEMNCLRQAIDSHCEHVKYHHQNEDEIYGSLLKSRFKYPKEAEIDHNVLDKRIKSIQKKISRLRCDDEIDDDLMTKFYKYSELLREHLEYEEIVILPLIRAYFTKDEVLVVTRNVLSKLSSFEIGALIHYMGPMEFRTQFMKQENIPRYVWYVQYRASHQLFIHHFIHQCYAIENNCQPTETKCCYLC